MMSQAELHAESAAVLAERYGMPDATLAPTALGAINDNFYVTWRGREHVLKRYRPEYNAPDHVRRVCAAQALAARGGVPVPELIVNAVGAHVTEADGTCYVLTARVPGHHLTRGRVPADTAAELGRVLGRMVAALADFGPSEPYTPETPETAGAALRAILSQAELRSEPLDAIACARLQHKLAALERLAADWPRLAALPSQWVHGDYQLTNVLFAEDSRVAAVLDFDNLRCRPRAIEFMRGLDLCFEPDGERLSEGALAFFRGYAAVVRPPAAEVRLYAPMRAYTGATGTWPLGTRYLEPEAYQERWDVYIKPPSDWWERNADRVTEDLLAVLAALPDAPDGAANACGADDVP